MDDDSSFHVVSFESAKHDDESWSVWSLCLICVTT
jgi:hypothetical protein